MKPLIDMPFTEILIIILLAIVVITLLIIIDKRKNRTIEEEDRQRLSVDEIIGRYGEPDQTVIVNPTCGNESRGLVMEYKEKGLLIINGEAIDKLYITDVSFSNFAMAYAPNDYKIIFLTSLPNKSVIRLSVGAGNDARYANEVVHSIKALL